MTNERKGHRMVGENVNNSSPKRKPKVAGIGHILRALDCTERQKKKTCQMNVRSISGPTQMLLGLLSQVSIDIYVIWRGVCVLHQFASQLVLYLSWKNLLLNKVIESGPLHFLRTWLSLFLFFYFYMSREPFTYKWKWIKNWTFKVQLNTAFIV